MEKTLTERIAMEAAYDRNLMFAAYAGDIADLVAELTARAERAEATLRAMTEQKEFFRVCWEEAEAALAQYRAELADRLYEPCVWRLDENASDYVTGCDGDWFDVSFGDMKYCPNCGHPVRIAPSDNDLLSDGLEEK